MYADTASVGADVFVHFVSRSGLIQRYHSNCRFSSHFGVFSCFSFLFTSSFSNFSFFSLLFVCFFFVERHLFFFFVLCILFLNVELSFLPGVFLSLLFFFVFVYYVLS